MAYLECKDLRRVHTQFSLDVSFSMDKGELLCIIGPSGSGKSTLLSLICGIDTPDSGTILLDGKDISREPIQRRNIGMVFQDFSLFLSMDVAKNIQYGMKTEPGKDKARETERLLEMVGLQGYGKRKVTELSGGEAQRVALARAVAAKPQILLLDEPLSALDAPLRKRIRTMIRQIHDSTGITMLYVTHDREEAFAIADRIMIMNGGTIESIGTPEEIYHHPKNLFSAFFTGDGTGIPMSLFGDKTEKKYLFFRPEDIIFDEISDQDKYVILKNAEVFSVEYTGSGYVLKLNFKGYMVTAYSQRRPESKTMDLAIPAEAVATLS
ncbi:MAG: ABC transporter ATP-binding protein [Spirochaetales bacterium]|nr:ABC transporter ATP-binding protein [Spirochaetales bacterium]